MTTTDGPSRGRLLWILFLAVLFLACWGYSGWALFGADHEYPIQTVPFLVGAVLGACVWVAKGWVLSLLPAGALVTLSVWLDDASDESLMLGWFALFFVVPPILIARGIWNARRGSDDDDWPTGGAGGTGGRLVGLNGYAGAGKDTAAAFLLEDGWTRASFADKLREFAYVLNPIVVQDTPIPLDGEDDPRFSPAGFPLRVRREHVRLRDLVHAVGWDRAKNENPDVRALLQRLGTDCGRNLLGENVWVDAVMSDLPDGDVVITDVRFPNEAKAVRDAGGAVIRIGRPGVRPVNGHLSETALDGYDFDAIVVNNSTPDVAGSRLRKAVALVTT